VDIDKKTIINNINLPWLILITFFRYEKGAIVSEVF